MNNLKLTCLFVVICFSFFACIKPEGTEGPQGPEGNANVKTTIFTVYDWEWTQSGNLWYYDKNLSIITSDIVANGIVLVFKKSTDSDHWQALPYTWPGTYEKLYRYWYSTEYLEIQIYSEYDYYEPTSDYTFKVAAIEGNLVTKAKNDGLNLNDYNQLKDYFNIE